jgi:hypothetical protein
MESDETTPGVGDLNVERLVGASYKPDLPDPEFVTRVHEQMQMAAASLACGAEARQLARLRRRLGFAMTIGLGLAASVLFAIAANRPAPVAQETAKKKAVDDESELDPAQGNSWSGQAGLGTTARPRPAGPAPAVIEVGAELATKSGERRRVLLADGSVLFVNQETRLRYVAARHLRLLRGEVYIEVAPLTPTPLPDGERGRGEGQAGQAGATFFVEAPDRKVSALGTRFSVLADAAGSNILVTQGKVQVSGLDSLVYAGQQLLPGSRQPAIAPRATHNLEWTRDLVIAAQSPLVPQSQHAGGALVAFDPHGQQMRLSLRQFHIDVHVEDGFARTTIDQTYFNHDWSRLEGTFYFPLPPDATLSRLAMYVKDGSDCRLMEGGMAQRDHARNVFETILHMKRDPALLEWVDGSTFKMRVFPLEPREEKRLILSYTQRLPALYGSTCYRFPAGHNLEVTGAWSFEARVKKGAKLRATSDSHPNMSIKADGADLVLSIKEKAAVLKQDVTVTVHDNVKDAAVQDAARLSSFSQGGAQYLMLRYRPTMAAEPKRERRDWVFLFEASAMRDPLLARVQIDVIKTLLENAEHSDTFTIVAAATRVHVFDTKARKATPANVQEALKFLDSVHLVGALDLGQAIAAALRPLASGKNPYLVHVGGGIATIGERREDVLVKKIPHGVRYVGVAVGKRWSRSFMKMAADATGGLFTQINPDEPVAWRAFELSATLNTPRMVHVRVVDNDEKVRFLCDASTLSQGEEICAIARIDPANKQKLPAMITFAGQLEGKQVVREIKVDQVADGAGYLPRQWAKLEIDRLLAEDVEKHKAHIILLSMSSYVMTPYTSLLVLETEADYAKYGVDRGRKNHWAMYPCPERIGLVHEPNGFQLSPGKGKADAEDVLNSILVRLPPRMLDCGDEPGVKVPAALTVTHLYLGAVLVPDGGTLVMGGGEARGDGRNELGPAMLDHWRESAVSPYLNYLRTGSSPAFNYYGVVRPGILFKDTTSSKARDIDKSIVDGKIGKLTIFSDPKLMPEPFGEVAGNPVFGKDVIGGETGEKSNLPAQGIPRPAAPGGFAPPLTGTGQALWTERGNPIPALLAQMSAPGYRVSSKNGGNVESIQLNLPAGGKPPAVQLDNGYLPPVKLINGDGDETTKLLEIIRETAYQRSQPPALLYQRPAFRQDPRVFGDLVWYAPGLNTTEADIASVLETEATPDPRQQPGKVDPEARKLIDGARTAAWMSVTLAATERSPSYVVYFNGAGQFTWKRVLPCGLTEQVICDGKMQWHLYPEIGLGAKRPCSRFQQAQLADLVPWWLPSADDLARGMEVILVAKGVVGIEPIGAAAARDAAGKPVPFIRTCLIFAPDGRLSERQLVKMPDNKLLACQLYDANGTVETLDVANDKALSTVKLALAAAEAPSLVPSVADLVVVPMPLRTEKWLDKERPNPSGQSWAEYYRKLDEDTAIAQFANMCAEQRWPDYVRMLLAVRFHDRGDKRLGFYVLMASGGDLVNPAAAYSPEAHGKSYCFDVAREHPGQPLAKYLAYHFDAKRRQQWSDLGDLGGPADGFVQRLARFRHLFAQWQSGRAALGEAADQASKRKSALEYLGKAPLPIFDWALLMAVHDHTTVDDPAVHKAMAGASKRYGESTGLAYIARYELARVLGKRHDHELAKKQFRELFLETLEQSAIPPVDSDFRDCLNSGARPGYEDLIREAATKLAKRGQPLEIVALAWQAHLLGEAKVADELLAQAVSASKPGQQRGLVRLAMVQYLAQTKQVVRADVLLQVVLTEDPLRQSPTLWRWAAHLAAQRRLVARSALCLDHALDLEFRDLPPVIDLKEVRDDYKYLLQQYQEVANAMVILEQKPPREFIAKVVSAADRWRVLDPDPAEVCRLTAKILQTLGVHDLAWDYMTTPIGLGPNEAAPWLQLAQSLQSDGELDLADRAYAVAQGAESTNAQILWDRAQNLFQAGRTDEGLALYRALAMGQWQERFQGLQAAAKLRLKQK